MLYYSCVVVRRGVCDVSNTGYSYCFRLIKVFFYTPVMYVSTHPVPDLLPALRGWYMDWFPEMGVHILHSFFQASVNTEVVFGYCMPSVCNLNVPK